VCPAHDRGCFGCFGPTSQPNTQALAPALRAAGLDDAGLRRVYRTYTGAAPAFTEAAVAAGAVAAHEPRVGEEP
jgi:hypothetical protein